MWHAHARRPVNAGTTPTYGMGASARAYVRAHGAPSGAAAVNWDGVLQLGWCCWRLRAGVMCAHAAPAPSTSLAVVLISCCCAPRGGPYVGVHQAGRPLA